MASPSLASAAPRSSGEAPGLRHACQFYEDDAHLFDVVSCFVGAGLEAGEPALIIATRPHREALRTGLQARGFDVDRALALGQLTFLDAQATLAGLLAGAAPEPALFKEKIGALLDAVQPQGRIRVLGEMVDQLGRDGNPKGAI